jgi:hypothetical protein
MDSSRIINNFCKECYKRKIRPHIEPTDIDNLLIDIKKSNFNMKKNIFVVDSTISYNRIVNTDNIHPPHFTIITSQEFKRSPKFANQQYYPNFHFTQNNIYCNIISMHEIRIETRTRYCLYAVFTKNRNIIRTNDDAMRNNIFEFAMIISETIYKNTNPKYDICIVPVLHNSNSININNIEPMLYFEQFKNLMSQPNIISRQDSNEAENQYLYNTTRKLSTDYIKNSEKILSSVPKLFRQLSNDTTTESPRKKYTSSSPSYRGTKRRRSSSESYNRSRHRDNKRSRRSSGSDNRHRRRSSSESRHRDNKRSRRSSGSDNRHRRRSSSESRHRDNKRSRHNDGKRR